MSPKRNAPRFVDCQPATQCFRTQSPFRRSAEAIERAAELTGRFTTLFAQLALCAHVLKLKWVNILLAVICRYVAKNDDVTAFLQG